MASIDKIHMTSEQGVEFWNWLLFHDEECKELTGRSMVDSLWKSENGFVANNPEAVDWYLYHKCDLDFIHKRLQEQYPTEPPRNKFHEIIELLLSWETKWQDASGLVRFIEEYADELDNAIFVRKWIESQVK